MTAGIIGLGLIGGSFAKAYHAEGHKVYAYNRSKEVLDFALLSGAVDEELTKENIGKCDIIIISVYPEAAFDYLKEMAPYIGKYPVVIDACGTKRKICNMCFPLAEQCGFTFVGCHPMAGTHKSGFKYSRADMYKGASMVIVPPRFDDIELLERVEHLLGPCHFGNFQVTTAEHHDEMIAFTSQMPHILANAFIKSPTAQNQRGFSGGSYRDMTRVAYLNPAMWAELFLENKDYVLRELDFYIASLQQYREAVARDDFDPLIELLEEGTKAKMEIDAKANKENF